ncbi:MAG: hypothetical protein RUMPE_00081 [Eubacteriales bacterium SKADARSKE-1]|nr:hypothetical protein [Eubacteriales bacterium SKADARSKE-1]
MYSRNPPKKSKTFIYFLSLLSAALSIFTFFLSLSNVLTSKKGALRILAASFVLPSGKNTKINVEHVANNGIYTDIISLKNKNFSSNTQNIFSDSSIDEIAKNTPIFNWPHEDGESTYKIVECLFGASGSKFENFFINNKTSLDINFGAKLNERPDINIKKDGSPQVLVFHTHTTEAYMDKDQGFYYQNFHPRSLDPKFNVVQVGDAICKSLENSGIKTIHDTTCHDDPGYSGSYNRSAQTIDKNLKKYPSICVVLDIHRDTIENKEKTKIKPTFSINGKKAAQIMIIAGCDADGTLEHPDWEHNLKFALRLHKQVETMFPGMTRSLLFKNSRYNMHKSHGSLLIEVGSDANTLNEAVYSGALLGRALSEVLNKLT